MSSPNTDIELVQTALADFDRVAAGLAQLSTNYAGVVYDVEEARGLEHAKAARVALRTPRYEVERIRKAAKAQLLAITRKLDTEAARITAEIMKLEEPIDQQIKAEEARREAEKQAQAQAELNRITAINQRIADMRHFADVRIDVASDSITEIIQSVTAIAIDASFAEFQTQADDAKRATLARLQDAHANAVSREAEAERVKTERAELIRLRAEHEERNRTEQARIAEQERVARIVREQETARLAEVARLEREALAVERAELDRRAAELTRRAEIPASTEAPPVHIVMVPHPATVPTLDEMIQVLADHYGVPYETVGHWLKAYDWSAAA